VRLNILVIAHSAGAADRAAQLFSGRTGVEIVRCGPGVAGGLGAGARVLKLRPEVLYVVDIGISTAVAAAVARTLGIPVVVDTGDLVFELERSRGSRSVAGLALVWIGERITLACARHVIVRGRAHLELIEGRPVSLAPDLAPENVRPVSDKRVRSAIGYQDCFVVGLVGSLNKAPRLGISYGWDLVEALPATLPIVRALIVGDGAALPSLRKRAEVLGVADRCSFVGRIPTSEIAYWISAMDAAISTQTNDNVGAVRTTGKLPMYLACGCPVLASDVGEAKHILGPLGWTIPYEGVVDRRYPARLSDAINRWASDPGGQVTRRKQALALHREFFDSEPVRQTVWNAIATLKSAQD
jgi:glycosyltransferase involved in cell wall biosynthesis